MRKKLLITIIAAVASAACNDTTGTEELRSNVSVSFSTQSAAAPTPTAALTLATAAMLDDTLTSGSDTLIITRAQMVLREIDLKRATSVDCDVEPEPAECEEVELGPVLVDLPLVPGAARRFVVTLPAGTYMEIEFEIHKVSGDDPEDAAFRQANPDFIDKSIRVQGTFNGDAFLFESDLNVAQELRLVPALVVTEGVGTNVTVRVDLATWFRSLTGGLVHPATGNEGGINRNLIRDNIKQSLEAFEDEDEDGDESDEG